MHPNRFRPVFAPLAIALAATIGCVSFSAGKLPEKTAGNLFDRESWDGLTIGAALPGGEADVARLYGRNLLDWDILPIAIYLQNTSADARFEVQSSDVVFAGSDETAFDFLSAEEVADEVGYSYVRSIVPFLFAIIPGFFSTANISNTNQMMLNDYLEKCLDDVTLPESDATTYRRVAFFRPKDGRSLDEVDLGQCKLSVRATRFMTKESASDAPTEKTLTIVFRKR